MNSIGKNFGKSSQILLQVIQHFFFLNTSGAKGCINRFKRCAIYRSE